MRVVFIVKYWNVFILYAIVRIADGGAGWRLRHFVVLLAQDGFLIYMAANILIIHETAKRLGG